MQWSGAAHQINLVDVYGFHGCCDFPIDFRWSFRNGFFGATQRFILGSDFLRLKEAFSAVPWMVEWSPEACPKDAAGKQIQDRFLTPFSPPSISSMFRLRGGQQVCALPRALK